MKNDTNLRNIGYLLYGMSLIINRKYQILYKEIITYASILVKNKTKNFSVTKNSENKETLSNNNSKIFKSETNYLFQLIHCTENSSINGLSFLNESANITTKQSKRDMLFGNLNYFTNKKSTKLKKFFPRINEINNELILENNDNMYSYNNKDNIDYNNAGNHSALSQNLDKKLYLQNSDFNKISAIQNKNSFDNSNFLIDDKKINNENENHSLGQYLNDDINENFSNNKKNNSKNEILKSDNKYSSLKKQFINKSSNYSTNEKLINKFEINKNIDNINNFLDKIKATNDSKILITKNTKLYKRAKLRSDNIIEYNLSDLEKYSNNITDGVELQNYLMELSIEIHYKNWLKFIYNSFKNSLNNDPLLNILQNEQNSDPIKEILSEADLSNLRNNLIPGGSGSKSFNLTNSISELMRNNNSQSNNDSKDNLIEIENNNKNISLLTKIPRQIYPSSIIYEESSNLIYSNNDNLNLNNNINNKVDYDLGEVQESEEIENHKNENEEYKFLEFIKNEIFNFKNSTKENTINIEDICNDVVNKIKENNFNEEIVINENEIKAKIFYELLFEAQIREFNLCQKKPFNIIRFD